MEPDASAGPPRRAVLLLNPGARRGGEAIDAVVDRLRAAGVELVEELMRSPEQVARCLRAQAGTTDCAIVGGGDGGLRVAAEGLAATGLTLGILPLGTANDLARTLAIAHDLDAAVDVILAGHRRRIDLGSVNGLPFFNVASIGLSTELAPRALERPQEALGTDRLRDRRGCGRWRGRGGFSARITENGTVGAHPDDADRRRQRPLLRRGCRGGGACRDRRRSPRSLQPRNAHRLEPRADAAGASARASTAPGPR